MHRHAFLLTFSVVVLRASLAFEAGVRPWVENEDKSSLENACYMSDTNINGDNLNYGLDNKFTSVELCVDFCGDLAGANYFVWSDTSFFDPEYHYSCWCKANQKSTGASPGTTSGPLNHLRAPDLRPASGNLAASNQAHVLGYYSKVSDGPDGKSNYQQTTQLRHYLFFQTGINNWFINDVMGINQGYAFFTGTEQCITESTGTWEYWDSGVGDWVADPTARATCTDFVPPPPVEQCNMGSLCDACGVPLLFEGNVYCCKEHCDYGWIDYDPNLSPMCQCGL
eukprot:maker-scaffold20_size707684-snap-gene-4.20 protein:Tk03853 transcript:maker-scaffold20_size707684-snap-gene-4.20-mRNA-1 annotation:"hypothetical protein BRAFLDRAFT_79128"